METKLISRFQFSQLNMSSGSSQNIDIYLNQPLSFSDYPGGIVLETHFFGALLDANVNVYTRILGKNSSNQTVVLGASVLPHYYDPELGRPNTITDDYYFPYFATRFNINSDGSGIQTSIVGTRGSSTIAGFDHSNSAITQVIGLRLYRAASISIYTRGAYLKAYGLKQ